MKSIRKLIISIFILFGSGISCTVVDTELMELVLEIKNQNEELLTEVKSLQSKSDSLVNEIKKSAAKQEELLKKVTELQTELAKVLSQITSLNEKLTSQDADLDAIKAQLADLQKKYEGILIQLEQLQKLSQILAEIEKLKDQLSDLDEKYQVVINTLIQNQQTLDTLKSQVTILQTQLAQTLEKISQLTSQLGEQGADIEKILAQIEELTANCEEIKKLLESLLKGKSPIPTSGLVLWLPFNGNANDESGNDNNGIVKGATLTSDRFENLNKSYRFRGYGFNDHIRIPTSENLKNQTSFSFSLYFLLEDGALMNGNEGQGGPIQSGALLTREGDGIGTSPGFFSEIKILEGESRVGYFFTEGCCAARTYQENLLQNTFGGFSKNEWYHLVVSSTADNYKIYVNGQLKLEKSLSSNLNVLNNLDYYIGIFGWGSNKEPFWYPFLGKIDDVAIWNRTLTADEVSKIYKGEGF